jgi:hypothetical protein
MHYIIYHTATNVVIHQSRTYVIRTVCYLMAIDHLCESYDVISHSIRVID